jgi:outer membrane immunogenic protein
MFDGSVAMRRFLLAAVMFGAASGAQAADMPDFLRGSIPPTLSTTTRNWDGWYAGGQVDYSSANMDFSQSVVGLTNDIFRNSVLQQPTSQFSLLNKANVQGTGFGAFVGRNYQWDDLVFGLEANYNYMNGFAGSSSASLGPLQIVNPTGQVSPPGVTTTYAVKLTGTATAQIKDAITFRGRAGWATGNFLGYVFGGLAVGRMDVFRSVTSAVTRRDDITTTDIFGVTTTVIGPTLPVPSVSLTKSQERTNDFVVGWTGGLGMEYMLWGNVFVRGEWEYVKFVSVMNTPIAMNSARLGIGYKF